MDQPILNEWGNPIMISLPCRITGRGDEPVTVRGKIPYFDKYQDAYRFLNDNGYSTDRDSGRELGIVLECSPIHARQMFGDLLVHHRKMKVT